MQEHAAVVPPDYEGPVDLTRVDPGQTGLLGASLLCSMLGALGPMAAAFWCDWPIDSNGWVMAAVVAVSFVAMCAGFVLPWAIAERFFPVRELAGAALLRVDAHALRLGDLATVPWMEVLGVEGIPDEDRRVFVQTARHSKWLIAARTVDDMQQRLLPALHRRLTQVADADRPLVRGVAFSPWRFHACIGLGYVLAAGVAVAVLTADTGKGQFAALAVAVLLSVLVAWLVWAPAFWSLGAYSSRRGVIWQWDGAALHCIDRRRHRVLAGEHLRWRVRRARGIGYDFVWLSAREGPKRACVALPSDEAHALVAALRGHAAAGFSAARVRPPAP